MAYVRRSRGENGTSLGKQPQTKKSTRTKRGEACSKQAPEQLGKAESSADRSIFRTRGASQTIKTTNDSSVSRVAARSAYALTPYPALACVVPRLCFISPYVAVLCFAVPRLCLIFPFLALARVSCTEVNCHCPLSCPVMAVLYRAYASFPSFLIYYVFLCSAYASLLPSLPHNVELYRAYTSSPLASPRQSVLYHGYALFPPAFPCRVLLDRVLHASALWCTSPATWEALPWSPRSV